MTSNLFSQDMTNVLKKCSKNPFVGFANLLFLLPGGENSPQKKTLLMTIN